jgi:hypothetical protein
MAGGSRQVGQRDAFVDQAVHDHFALDRTMMAEIAPLAGQMFAFVPATRSPRQTRTRDERRDPQIAPAHFDQVNAARGRRIPCRSPYWSA